ncbi:HNH endonuclease signature motif containing protein [Enterobacter hormaechei]|uniref:HNH endonuclease signature motif containing protein n=1 Tax=Enterobacter hormaechei TaxID=158836 RepID=UPI0009B4BBC9|nr:HNH endonuclease signature motif containing protein [Enterobacter hormaechei]
MSGLVRNAGKTCSVNSCERPAHCKSMCQMHYLRLYKTGSLEAKSPLDRLSSKYMVDDSTGCWNWLAYINPDGYGMFKHKGMMTLAHKASYEILVKNVPDGFELDHLCHNRKCVNPKHLRVVTHTVNVWNRIKPVSSTGVMGVSVRESGKYRATLTRNGDVIFRKQFETLSEATAAVEKARYEFEGK